ncbi:MAG: hypothetical protein GWP05_08230 [Anaerolineaceae bacterium]|nr:hypothetical protein [Anaerolineaceae bacterium]
MLDYVAMVPSYHDMYGKHCTLAELVSLLGRFSVTDWVWQFSRLSCLLCGDRHIQGEYAGAFLRWIVPQPLKKTLKKWCDGVAKQSAIPVLFTERHVGILTELAIIYAAAEVPTPMRDGDERVIFDAFLMLVDLEQQRQTSRIEGRSKADELVTQSITVAERSLLIDPLPALARGGELYQVATESEDPHILEWAKLFQAATGYSLHSYFAGGLCALLCAYTLTPDQIATEWKPLPTELKGNNGEAIADVPGAYHAMKCRTTEEIARVITKLEPLGRPDDFNLIPLKKSPLLRLSQGSIFPLHTGSVADSLCEGVYYEVLAASIKGRIKQNRCHVGGVFGKLFEKYCMRLLEDRFGDRLLPNPARRDNGEEAADAIVLCSKGVILFQIKGSHALAAIRYAIKSQEENDKAFAKTGLTDAVSQIKDSILFLRQDLVSDLPDYGSTHELVIQPVVVTYEQVSVFGLEQPFVEGQRELAKVDRHVRPLVLMSVHDVEDLCALKDGLEIWDVLTEHIQRPNWRVESLHNFVVTTHKISSDKIRDRRERIWQRLKKALLPRQ